MNASKNTKIELQQKSDNTKKVIIYIPYENLTTTKKLRKTKHEKQGIVFNWQKTKPKNGRGIKTFMSNVSFQIIDEKKVIVYIKSVELTGPARARHWRAAVRNLNKNPNLVPPSKMFLTNQNGRPLYLFIER